MWTIVGYLAALCGSASLIPEVIKASKTHHLKDISWAMLFLLMVSSMLWGSYGLYLQDIPLVASALINLTLQTALVVMKKQYDITGKPFEHFFFKKKTAEENLEPASETESVQTENTSTLS